MINPEYDNIVFAAGTKLIDLTESACTTNKRTRREDNFNQAGKIFYFLNALTFADYLEDSQINNILECLKDTAELYDYPVAPLVNELEPPTINAGPIGPQGPQGPRGEDGGGTDFTIVNVATNTVADSFPLSLANAARWDVLVNGTSQRTGSIWATWLEDGSNITFTPEIGTGDLNGSTAGVELSVTIFGTEVRLNALVTSGTWTVTGSRYLIPNSGAGVTPPSTLANGAIWIGNASNVPVANTITGDISITSSGVVSITPLSIVDGDISASAAISVAKLSTLTSSRGVVTNGSGVLTTSVATATEVSYLSGVTSSIQTQLDSKLSAATGAISTVVSTNLTPSRAVVSDPSGKIAISGTTSTELGYVSGVTSSIQTQLDSKVSGSGINTKVVNIGDWNMASTGGVAVPHGLADYKKIRGVTGIIRDDLDTNYYAIGLYAAGASDGTWISAITSTTIAIGRVTPGTFATTAYDSTGYNRGYLLIQYAS